ncbi:WxL domain-containing protein [Enterococcus faecalis]|nr:WxL domain-containing protein [Enterococcus faecalis]
MPQINWKKWLVVGLSCSLFVDSVGSITALAETITSESPPTVASSTQEITTKISTTSNPATTDTSQEEVEQTAKTETTESANVGADSVGEQENEVTSIPETKSVQPKAAVAFPAQTYQFGFVNEAGQLINPANIPITYSYAKGSWTTDVANLRWSMVPGSASTVGNLKNVTMPAASITTPPGPTWAGNTEVYANFSIKIPRYYSSLSLYDRTGKINPTYPLPSIAHIGTKPHTFPQASVITWLGLTSKGNNMYGLEETYYNGDPAALKFPIFLMRLNKFDTAGSVNQYTTVNRPIYYHLTNRRVTENFVDTNGAKITPPSNFTQGKQTVINSDPYTFQQSGFLPETYKVGTKSYRFKGWYKGKTKTEPLATTKTPSYKVTYDGNDDLTVVYEEFSGYELPASTNQFGFVDEATNQLIAPDQVQMKYNLTLNENNQKTVMSSNLTGTDTATLKNLSVPVNYFEQYRVNTFYGASDITFTLPKRYKSINITKSDGKTDPAFPLPKIYNKDQVEMSHMPVTTYNKLKQLSGQTFGFNALAEQPEFYTKTLFGTESGIDDPVNYYTMSGPVYYYLENRKVTENFEDTNGAKITPPTGFTQGKQTAITSDAYTFKQAGTLPDSYTTGGKEYKFKGWYKGKTKTESLTTTKAPSYQVTYDDNDDLHVVYEEVTTTTLPGATYQFGFVDDSGKQIDPSKIKLTYDLWSLVNKESTILTKGNTGTNVANYKTLTLADKEIAIPNVESGNSVYSPINVTFQLPKNYSAMVPSTGEDSRYPVPTITYHRSDQGEGLLNTAKTAFDVTKVANQAQSYTLSNTNTEASAPGVPYPRLYRRYAVPQQPMYYTNYNTFSGPVYYVLTQRKVTEHFIDESGAKITPPTGFTQGHQIPIDSETFTYTSAKALPDTYTVGDKTYLLKGWYKGKTRPTPLDQRKTPSFTPTFDDNDDMTAVYHEAKKAATLSLKPIVNIIPNDSSLLWTATLKNTGEALLTKIKLAPTANWDTGISAPTQLAVQIAGQPYQLISVTPEQWQSGVDLGIELPVGAQASIAITSPKVTGQPDQVLSAEVTATGDFPAVTAQNAVRIQGTDQVITDPEETGFISVPTFDFGQVGVAGTKQQHSLKKAADYYGNGTRNPYLRMKQTQPNWHLTAQLSQPKSATDSLPTATRLLLGTAAATSFTDYNQATETRIPLGKTSAVTLTADNTATAVVANQQFTGSDVYQLDFTFSNIKLEVPANQGLKGQQYQAAVTWNLVTGP